jgi:hypothetical protein
MSAKCPICQKKAAARSQNGAFPFCSDRCKTIDLGKWLGGDYRIATNERLDSSSNDAAGSPIERKLPS